MIKRILVGVLSASILAAGGGALIYQAANEPATPSASVQEVEAAPASVADDTTSDDADVTDADDTEPMQSASTTQTDSLQALGDPWTASGTIAAMDAYGLTLTLDDGADVYVELGSPSYWQAQGVELAAGDEVTIEGYAGAIGYHAAVVTTADGQQIELRTADGQPLWSGGAGNGNAGSGQNGNGNSNQAQVQVDEWITVEGTITALAQNQATMALADGETLTFLMGQPQFSDNQEITLQVGDEIEVLGFYQNDQFAAGQITLLATGETILLRDPNGRPLWGGPGNQSGNGGNGGGGNGSGNGGGGNGGGNGSGSGNGGGGNGGGGNCGGNGSSGNGGSGNRYGRS